MVRNSHKSSNLVFDGPWLGAWELKTMKASSSLRSSAGSFSISAQGKSICNSLDPSPPSQKRSLVVVCA